MKGNRDSIIGAIQASLKKGEALKSDQTLPPCGDERDYSRELIGFHCEDGKTLVKTFMAEIERLSGKAFLVDSKEETRKAIESIVREKEIKRVALSKDHLLEEIGLHPLLTSLGVHLLPIHPDDEDPCSIEEMIQFRKEIEYADMGISGVDFALADSGTIFLKASAGRERSISLVPPIHLAIMRSDQILPSLRDLLPFFRNELEARGRLGSCYTLITGPSRTADIEQTLILGAHGPKELFVIVIEEFNEY